jgi:hypothetical protein
MASGFPAIPQIRGEHMREEATSQNPFDLLRASDYTDAEVLDHWVDISAEDGGLLKILKPRLVMPMLLLGGKGSGKTHLMRYCSAPVQAARSVYVRAEGMNLQKFSGKGQDEDTWSAIFGMYFELWLISNLLNSCAPLLSSDRDADFVTRVITLFDEDVSKEFSSISGFIEYISAVIRKIDRIVNNAALTKSVEGLEITFSPSRLTYGVPLVLSKLYPIFEKVLFVYLIDEAENFTAWQQRFVNSLIRYRTGNATIKVGARLYGIRSYDTLGSGEPIKRDAEYERVELDSFLREHEAQYKSFCRELIIKRLQLHNLPLGRYPASDLEAHFEILDPTAFYQKATLDILKTWDSAERERPYLHRLRNELEEIDLLNQKQIEEVLTLLKLPSYPLLEKVNLLLFYRKWPSTGAEAIRLAESIARQSAAFINGGRAKSETYRQVLNHFGSDLLSQLFRDCQRACPYAGLDTLIHLSQGSPRNLLAILKHIHRRALFAGESPFASGTISVDSQSRGVMDSSAWFWEDAQPESDAQEVRDSVEALAVLFRTIRYSERPSECDLCTFSLSFGRLTDQARHIVETAENWSYLIRNRVDAKNRNTQAVEGKYQLAPMLAPKWALSPHRRGSIEVQTDLANALFDREHQGELQKLFKRRVQKMQVEYFSKATHKGLLL